MGGKIQNSKRLLWRSKKTFLQILHPCGVGGQAVDSWHPVPAATPPSPPSPTWLTAPARLPRNPPIIQTVIPENRLVNWNGATLLSRRFLGDPGTRAIGTKIFHPSSLAFCGGWERCLPLDPRGRGRAVFPQVTWGNWVKSNKTWVVVFYFKLQK